MALGLESSLEAAGALVATTPKLGSISNPLGSSAWSWGSVGIIRELLSDQIHTCLVPCIGGIELQLSCGVRIKPALGVGLLCSQNSLVEGVVINTKPGRKAKFLMMEYPLSFHLEGVYSNKTTKTNMTCHTN